MLRSCEFWRTFDEVDGRKRQDEVTYIEDGVDEEEA